MAKKVSARRRRSVVQGSALCVKCGVLKRSKRVRGWWVDYCPKCRREDEIAARIR